MNSQKIALFGTSDEVSQRLAAEALRRGCTVTAIVQNENELKIKHPNFKVVKGDVRKKEDVEKYARGNDLVICSHQPTKANPREHLEVTRAVIEGVKKSGVNNLIFAAHPIALSLETSEEFYNSFKPVLQTQREALNLLQNEKGLHWGYVHSIEPEKEEKSGKYLASEEAFFSQPEGKNRIQVKNYASAIMDEAEKNEVELHEHHQDSGR